MRILILAGVAASALALTACNREQPAKTPTDEAVATPETGSMSADAPGGAMSSGSTSRSGSTSDSSATSDEAMTPAMPPADSPVSEATRQGAKEKAESTNLHPPTN